MKILRKTREDILEDALTFISKEGLEKATLRSLAAHSGVSVGSYYNYFGDKEALLNELMKYYWRDALSNIIREEAPQTSLSELVDWLYNELMVYSEAFHRDFIVPSGLTHSALSVQQSMSQIFQILYQTVLEAVSRLPFNENKFGTREDFSHLVIDQIVACLARKQKDLGSFQVMLDALEV